MLVSSLNLCEECGFELKSRTVTDGTKLGAVTLAAVLVIGAAGYGGYVTIRAMLVRKATDLVVGVLGNAYDPATLTAVRSRVQQLIKQQGRSPQVLETIQSTLQAEDRVKAERARL